MIRAMRRRIGRRALPSRPVPIGGAAMFDLQIILDDVVAVADRPARPSSFARSNRCLIDERCHRVPPHGVRSRMASSWEAICWSVRSGAAAAMPATSRSNRSFPVLWPGAIEQVRLDDAFRDQSSDGAAEPLGGPGCRPAMVQDPRHVAPGLARAHAQ
jgi:hypothetical protein